MKVRGEEEREMKRQEATKKKQQLTRNSIDQTKSHKIISLDRCSVVIHGRVPSREGWDTGGTGGLWVGLCLWALEAVEGQEIEEETDDLYTPGMFHTSTS
jgi:hypothetical protein